MRCRIPFRKRMRRRFSKARNSLVPSRRCRMHIRSLNLKREVTPENAPAFAQDVVASAARITGDELDYSVASLEAVDRIIERIRAKGGTIDNYAETMFCFGCYVGEVFVRHAGGRWIATPEDQFK